MPRVQRYEPPPPDTLGGRIGRHRKAAGLTVTRLARLLGVNRNTIANYESGRTEPTANDLLKLAEALGCDLMDLLSESPRPRASRFAFRAHSILLKDPHITMMARKYLRAYREIEEITGIQLTPRLPRFPIDPEEPPFVPWIEMATDRVRESSGLRDCGPENLVTALESLGVRCLFFRYEGKGLEGLSALQDDMPLMMLRDRDKAIERTIFSGAHELGHLVLHPYLFVSNPDEGDNGHDSEKEADQFAGYYLVPRTSSFTYGRKRACTASLWSTPSCF